MFGTGRLSDLPFMSSSSNASLQSQLADFLHSLRVAV
jgi:hypothetical protein